MLEKGTFQYINRRKKRTVLMALGILLVAVLIFVVGLLLNKMSRANIFTVLAILCVLPWAKQVVALVVLFPYQSVSKERFDKVKKTLDSYPSEEVELMTDMVITSQDKVMQLDFAVVGYGQVIALVGKKGQDIAYIRKYLTDGVHNWGDYKVKILDSEKLFLHEIEDIKVQETDQEEAANVKSYLHSLLV